MDCIRRKLLKGLYRRQPSQFSMITIWVMLIGLAACKPSIKDPDVKKAVQGLKHSSFEKRVQAAQALGSLGTKAGPAASHLAKALEDKQWAVRYAAVVALGKVGPSASVAAPGLYKALTQDKYWSYAYERKGKKAALHALIHIGAAAEPFLRKVFLGTDIEKAHRKTWAWHLNNAMAETPEASVVLMKWLDDKDAALAKQALQDLRRLVLFASRNKILAKLAPKSIAAKGFALLHHKDTKVQLAAAKLVNAMKLTSDEAATKWLKAMEHSNPLVQAEAITAVGQLGEKAKAALPTLIQKLKESKNEWIRSSAAQAIGKMGPAAQSALPALMNTHNDKKSSVHYQAIRALYNLGVPAKTAVPYLIQTANNKKFASGWSSLGYVQKETALQISRYGKEALPWVKKALQRKPYGTQVLLAALGNMKDQAASAVPLVLPYLQSKDQNLRSSALDALAAINVKSKELAKALPLLVFGKGWSNRETARKLLAKMGANGAAAVPEILRVLESGSDENRDQAAEVLGDLAPHSIAGLPALRKAMSDKSRDVRSKAVWALGQFGTKASSAIPAVLEALRSGHVQVGSASLALARMKAPPHTTVPLLIEQLKKQTWGTQQYLLMALGSIGRDDPKVLPILMKFMEDSNTMLRKAAMIGLKALGPKATPAIPKLIKRLQTDKDYLARGVAVHVLANIGAKAKAAVPAMIQVFSPATKSWNRDLKVETALALRKMGKEGHKAIPALLRAMTHMKERSNEVKVATALTLGVMGVKKKVVLNKLKAIATNPKLGTKDRKEASSLLKSLGQH